MADASVKYLLPIVTKQEARESGLTTYFTGKPCKHGHLERKLVVNSVCLECDRQRKRRRRPQKTPRNPKTPNPESIARRRAKCREYQRAFRQRRGKQSPHESREYYKKHRESCQTASLRYYRKNKQKCTKRQRERKRERYHSDATYKAAVFARRLLIRTLKRVNKKKTSRTSDLLGYSADKLQQRIEFQFRDGMCWANRRDWHIDHKISIARFIERGVTDLKIINALSNLQPLWRSDNIRKGRNPMPIECRKQETVLADLRSAERALIEHINQEG
jgi:hypothetical protein